MKNIWDKRVLLASFAAVGFAFFGLDRLGKKKLDK
jgi:hypothetical protein